MDFYYSKRSVGVAILLSIITCGIYAIYWLYQILSTLYRLTNQQNNAGMDIVLTFITCGIYGIYLVYKIGKLESHAHYNMGLPPKDESVLYLILAIFAFHIVVYAIVQSNINNLIDRMHGHGPHGPGGPWGGPGPQGPGSHGGSGFGQQGGGFN